jgi:alanyl-tRNA synthetase
MTDRLYYHDATLAAFDATVVKLEDGGRRVYLDRTAFYPTSGGQPHDTGQLAGVEVTDVVDEDVRIGHVLAEPLPTDAAGAAIRGKVHWPRRLDFMQQHTGQHLISAVCEEMLHVRTVSVHFGNETSTLDVELPAGHDASDGLTGDVLLALERRANDIVAEARPVSVTFEDASEATALRKESQRSGTLRIVTIDRLDRSACGGTHVARTSEIGPILLRRQERVRSAIRQEFVCGRRALDRAHRDLAHLSRIARLHSSSIDEVASVVESHATHLRDLEASHRRLQEHLAGAQADTLYHATQPGTLGIRTIVERRESGGADGSRQVALAVARSPRAVFIATSLSPPGVLFATSEDSGIDAAKTLRPLLQQAGGRGGGSARLAQGSLPAPELVDEVVEALRLAGVAPAPNG